MKVEMSPDALADLKEIGERIASDNPVRAVSFVDELRSSCFGIAELPHGYPAIELFESAGLRRRNHGRYAILYQVRSDRIVVARILHGARDINALIKPA